MELIRGYSYIYVLDASSNLRWLNFRYFPDQIEDTDLSYTAKRIKTVTNGEFLAVEGNDIVFAQRNAPVVTTLASHTCTGECFLGSSIKGLDFSQSTTVSTEYHLAVLEKNGASLFKLETFFLDSAAPSIVFKSSYDYTSVVEKAALFALKNFFFVFKKQGADTHFDQFTHNGTVYAFKATETISTFEVVKIKLLSKGANGLYLAGIKATGAYTIHRIKKTTGDNYNLLLDIFNP